MTGFWTCKDCGHLVVSDSRPEPIRWSDGHVCRFEESESLDEAMDKHEKGGRMKNIAIVETVWFRYLSDLAGVELKAKGTVVGGPKEIRKKWPCEFGGLPDDQELYMVKRKDNFGNEYNHVVYPDELIINEKEEK